MADNETKLDTTKDNSDAPQISIDALKNGMQLFGANADFSEALKLFNDDPNNPIRRAILGMFGIEDIQIFGWGIENGVSPEASTGVVVLPRPMRGNKVIDTVVFPTASANISSSRNIYTFASDGRTRTTDSFNWYGYKARYIGDLKPGDDNVGINLFEMNRRLHVPRAFGLAITFL